MNARNPLLGVFALGSLFLAAVGPAVAQNWIATSAPNSPWGCIACSADGQRMVAGGYAPGPVYISTNAGATWTVADPTGRNWNSAASSTDGSHLVVSSVAGSVLTSTNFGETWTERGLGIDHLSSVASSSDGNRLVACGSGVLVSTNAGLTWAQTSAPIQSETFPPKYYSGVDSSADGVRLVAVVYGGMIYNSIDGGVTWLQRNAPTNQWISVASSADGSKLVAAIKPGGIYVSSDSGTNWTLTGPSNYWQMTASSDDGSRLFVAASASPVNTSAPVYTSQDSGVTWKDAGAPLTNWSSVACSADGSIAAATTRFGLSPPYTGQIYIWSAIPSLNIWKSGDDVLISWPHSSSSAGFTLEQNSNLKTSAWVRVSAAATVTNGVYQALISPALGNQFYRLSKPGQ